jgi:hypothetical protein
MRIGAWLGFIVMVAGCAGPSTPAAPSAASPEGVSRPASPAEFDETTGGIDGAVHDDELRPIPAATVHLIGLGLVAVTDADGHFAFSHLAPGTIEVRAEKEGYGGTSVFTAIRAGAANRLDMLLSARAIAEGYHVTQIQKGVLGCSFSVAGTAFTGCDAWEYVGINLTQYIPEHYSLDWRLQGLVSDWKGASFEMEWHSTQALGRSLAVIWNVKTCDAFLENEVLGRAQGRSPLHRFLNESWTKTYLSSKMQPCKEPGKVCNDAKGCTLQSVVYAEPDFLGPGAPADATVVWQQAFTQYQTEFYFREGPPEFRAIADA